MNSEKIKNIIQCLLDNYLKTYEDIGKFYTIRRRSVIKLCDLFNVEGSDEVSESVHKFILRYPELFSMYGFTATEYDDYYNGELVDYELYSSKPFR